MTGSTAPVAVVTGVAQGIGRRRGQRMLAGSSSGTLVGHGLAVDEHLSAPHAPGLVALDGALQAAGAQRAGPAELLGQLQLTG